MTSTTEAVRYELVDGIAHLILDDPSQSANTMNQAYADSMAAAVDRLAADIAADPDQVKGAIVSSAKKTFFAGGDLRLMTQAKPEDAQQLFDHVESIKATLRKLETIGKPVVAAINGAALGGGLEIALACDFRIATADAQLGFPEVNLGLLPGGGGTQRAPRLVSPGRAKWLAMSGERIDAPTASQWGLVEFVVDDLEEGIARYVEPLDKQSPHAIGQIKALFRETRDARSDEREVQAFAACLQSEDGQEGVAAFLEKRQPNWAGR